MRLLRLVLLTAALTATAGGVPAQFPGGDRGDRSRGGPPSGFGGGPPGGWGSSGRSGFSMDPNERFNQMSGGKDSFNINQLPADQKDRLVRFAPMMGLQIPPDGTVTRQAYVTASAAMQQRFSSMRGGPPGVTMTMTAPGTVPGATPGTPGAAPTLTPSPSGGPPQWGQPGGFPGGDRDRGRGGFDPSTMPDDQVRQFMSRYDRDGDGRISQAEAQTSDRMRDAFATYDVNRDGYIDLSEYRGYLIARMSPQGSSSTPGSTPPGGFPPGGYPPGGYPPGGYPGTYPGAPGQTQPPAEDPRPVVYRYGKLPKDFPYSDLDEDRDGQVGLYEWKAASKTIAEFKELDLNRDGYLTAEEFLRARPPAAPAADKGGSMADERGSGDRSSERTDRSSSDRSRPSRDDRGRSKDEKKEDKRQPGGNPFSKSRN